MPGRRRCTLIRSADELDVDRRRDQARVRGAGEQGADRLATLGAVIDRPVVDVHPDEPVGQGRVEVAGVLEGVVERLLRGAPGRRRCSA